MTNTKFQNLIQNGYSLDLGDIISKSIENFKKIAVTAAGAIFVASLLIMAVYMGLLGVIYGFGDFVATLSALNPMFFTPMESIIYVLVVSVISALIYPFTAGLLQMAHNAEVGKEFNFSTAFEHYKSIYFKDLALAGFCITLLTTGGSTLMQQLGSVFIGTIITYVFMFLLTFTIPLIIFGKLNFTNAITTSVQLVVKQPFVILISLILAVILACFGIIALCVGILFTIPIIYSTQYILYKSGFGIDDVNEIEQIGNNSDY